ncbi:hypothetical protein Tco_0240043 [Tanacetum coccineum]
MINTITIIRNEDEPKEEEIIEPNATKDNNHNTIVEIKEKVGGEACDDTKGVNEVDKESEESEEEVEKEE